MSCWVVVREALTVFADHEHELLADLLGVGVVVVHVGVQSANVIEPTTLSVVRMVFMVCSQVA